MDPANGVSQCHDEREDPMDFALSFSDMDNYVCFSPSDVQAILDYMRRKGGKAKSN